MHVRVRWLALVFAPAVLVAQQDSTPSADPFASATPAELDSLYGPLLYIMRSNERGLYGERSTEGKRAFLRRFWKRRDPTPGTTRNEARERFYARVTTANRMFREGGAAETPGWRTDRGRIYLTFGPPDRVLRRPHPPSTNPYEVWRYGRARKFVFFDLTRFGNYALIWSDEPTEPTRPDWRVLLGPEALEDISRF